MKNFFRAATLVSLISAASPVTAQDTPFTCELSDGSGNSQISWMNSQSVPTIQACFDATAEFIGRIEDEFVVTDPVILRISDEDNTQIFESMCQLQESGDINCMIALAPAGPKKG